MSITKQNTKYLFNSLDHTFTELMELISAANSIEINSIPFRKSWTAAQLTVHIMKSNKAIVQAMGMEENKAQRNPGERIQELKAMFLNFNIKFLSPDFIKPEQQIYEKSILVADLKSSIEQFKNIAHKADFSEIIRLPSFGELTKFELAWFVLYHTKRHIHQLKEIFACLFISSNFIEGRSKRPMGISTDS